MTYSNDLRSCDAFKGVTWGYKNNAKELLTS